MRDFFSWLLTINNPDEDVRRRGRNLVILALGLICTALLFVPTFLIRPTPNIVFAEIGLAVLMYIGVLLLGRRGLVTLGALLFVSVLTLTILAAALSSGMLSTSPFYLILSLLIAGLCLRPWQIWVVLAANIISLTVTILLLPTSPLLNPNDMQSVYGGYVLLGIVGLMSFLAAKSTSSALKIAQGARQQAETAAHTLSRVNADLEATVAERTAALQAALQDVQARADAQADLLDEVQQQRELLRELSVPVIPISASTLIMPLVGALDSIRLQQIKEQALHALEYKSAHYLVLDITGVPIVDSQVAQGLLSVVQAARLMGAQVLLVGIRPEVAQAIVGLGLDLRDIYTTSDLQSALSHIALN